MLYEGMYYTEIIWGVLREGLYFAKVLEIERPLLYEGMQYTEIICGVRPCEGLSMSSCFIVKRHCYNLYEGMHHNKVLCDVNQCYMTKCTIKGAL